MCSCIYTFGYRLPRIDPNALLFPNPTQPTNLKAAVFRHFTHLLDGPGGNGPGCSPAG